ncbi:MAG TPA: DUF2059 domain-containing protein [Methylocella sp.]|nr:DUF2059 domain-containing protein [Methylocella sp.]
MPSSIEKRLESFDPAAVAAARHYYTSPVLKAAFEAMLPKMAEAMDTAIKRANPELDTPSQRAVRDATQEALSTRFDLVIDMAMTAALEVFSKDELIALDQFYSSPVGQSVITKMPQVMNRLPAMMQVLMPLMLEDVRAKMKAKGKDLRL